jgi:hypothetical protein
VAHGLAALGAAVALLLGTMSTAYAAGSPPVTTPDQFNVLSGEGQQLDVLANDSDPDGDRLSVCGLGPLPHPLARTFIVEGKLILVAGARARGRFELTYYACDGTNGTPGSLTVRVRPLLQPVFDVVALGDAPPGVIQLVNSARHRTFRCVWRPVALRHPTGHAEVRPRSTVTIHVRAQRLYVDCSSGNEVVHALVD